MRNRVLQLKHSTILFFILILLSGCQSSPNTNQSVTAGKLSPPPHLYSPAIIQVFGARTKGAKQALAIHTWISTKRANAKEYTSYEIIGWRLRRGPTALVVRQGNPDRDWWGSQPQLLLDKRGEQVEELINKIEQAVADYPYKTEYHAWPGPNSNTFTAFIARAVPELKLDLPSTAIGKDYRDVADVVGMSPSGQGVQFSLWGLLGVTAGIQEGLELNILGLNFELDVFDLALELPGVGRLGFSETDEQEVIAENQRLLDEEKAIANKNKKSEEPIATPPDD